MSSHGGGGVMCIFFEICENRPFRKCDSADKQCTAPLDHPYSESSSSSALPFSGRAGTPLGQTSPCLWTGTYFFSFPQSCNICAFSGTHPSLRGTAHRPSVVRSTFRCLVNQTLHQWHHCTLMSTIHSQHGAADSLGQVLFEYTPHTPTYGHSVDTNEVTRAATP